MPRRPDIAQAVERIGKYAGGEAWSERRRAHFQRMMGRQPERYGLEIENCYEEIAGLGHANTLFGFLIESFFAAEFGAEKGNVIDEYLRRRGWQETPRAREYLSGIRATPVSLYEVRDVLPGQWIELSDLCRGGPPRRIAEESGSRNVQRWDRLAARVVTAHGEEMLTGGVLPLTLGSAEALDGILTRLRDKGRRSAEAIARKYGVDPDLEVEDGVPRMADSVFLQVWLKGLLDVSRRPLPNLANTDGEPMVLTKTRLPVAPDATAEIARRLDALNDWQREPDDTSPAWIWLPVAETPATIHATARLTDGAIVIETNSRERMERALAALRGALGSLVGKALTSHEDPVQLLRHAAPRDQAEPSGWPSLAEPGIEAVLRQYRDAHYRRVMEEPVPMLGDKTPRECARTKAGRARLVRWLKELENGELHNAANAGQAAYDFTWIWKELGVRPE